jgi:glutaredoxin 3
VSMYSLWRAWSLEPERALAYIWIMAKIEIYTQSWCGYCFRAKKLLESKGAPFTEIDLGVEDRTQEMIQRSNGGRSVPQIFIDGKHVGGCDDLHALDTAGKLDPMLRGVAS